MYKLTVLLLVIFICPSAKLLGQTEAARQVFTDIVYLKSQVENYTKGKPANFNSAEYIAELTGIYPQKADLNYIGIFYTPTNEEVDAWLKWFEENERYLSYYDDSNDKYKIQGKIIQLTLPDGTIRYCIDEMTLESLKN